MNEASFVAQRSQIALNSIKVANFKNIENLEIVFSNTNDKPITVVQSLVGLGKTSVANAVKWALYGDFSDPNGAAGVSSPAPGNWDVARFGLTACTRVEVGLTLSTSFQITEFLLVRLQASSLEKDNIWKTKESSFNVYKKTLTIFERVEDPKTFVDKHLIHPWLQDFVFFGHNQIWGFTSNEASGQISFGDTISKVLDAPDLISFGQQVNPQSLAEKIGFLRARAQEKFSDLVKGLYESNSPEMLVNAHFLSLARDYSVTLTWADQVIPFASMTGAMRRCIALALLLAFTESFTCRLPVILDDPLGALNDEMQTSFINSLGSTSSQVVLLTDAENLGKKTQEALLGKTGKMYELYWNSSNRTVSRELNCS